ncbi:MAG: holin family protein [Marinosulfonomonas sp.]
MGLIEMVFSVLFGNGRNAVKETIEVFRENADSAGQRDAAYRAAALGQFAAEFKVPRRGGFDRFMDGLNRVPRPALAFGTLALFVSAMVNPVWFASRMQGIALVPQPLWWLLGAIVSFYFGARYQVKTQDFQKTLVETLAQSATVLQNIDALDRLGEETELPKNTVEDNPALADWRASHAK